MELRKTYRFEASHILPKHPGKCSRLHGHSWVLHVWVKGPVDADTGFVMDFADISLEVSPIIEKLDHRHLGVFVDNLSLWSPEGFYPVDIYPTSENLLLWIAEQLPLTWSKLALEETCTSYAELSREEWDASRNKG